MKTKYIAHITIEAETPLKVGSNASDFIQDSPVQKDWNTLPMILGTSIAGVLRKDFDKNLVDDIFGKENGSKVVFSNALLLDEKGEVCEELLFDSQKSNFLKCFDTLPIREHTAITDKGIALEHSKFDEEVVYKGTQFKFSIEMIEDDKNSFDVILNLLSNTSFRLGGGSTKGFGKIEIKEIVYQAFDRDTYVHYSSSLNHHLSDKFPIKEHQSTTHTQYELNITPDDFFIFGSGFGDSDSDSTSMYEKVIDYEKKGLSKKQILLPASSIKGALAHRTAFYYNKAIGATIESANAKVEDKNDAVKAIFGHKKALAEDRETKLGQKGKILISDCFQVNNNQSKTFDHVSIDRFTGGAIDGALFQEKTICDDKEYEIEILLEKAIDKIFIEAFESALKDICTGVLALGGMTTKGHGIFTGTVLRDGVQL
jgi:CRISPR/Cas system CSM-associated protein Csm3 (group 7 of RAMP superfamily)